MKTALIVQARMSSNRLPGKVLKEVLDKPLLGYLIERLKHAQKVDHLIIATTTNPADDKIEQFCTENNVRCYRGSENDVLSRYYQAAKSVGAQLVIRVTADCPLLTSDIIDDMITQFEQHKDEVDYLSNTQKRTFPRGMDVELFTYKVLEKINSEAEAPAEREHVTPYIYHNPRTFIIKDYLNPKGDQSKYRLTVDVAEDFILIQKIISHLYPKDHFFTLEQIIQLLKKHPDWAYINHHIAQKKIHEKLEVSPNS